MEQSYNEATGSFKVLIHNDNLNLQQFFFHSHPQWRNRGGGGKRGAPPLGAAAWRATSPLF